MPGVDGPECSGPGATHHLACACREAHFVQVERELAEAQAVIAQMRTVLERWQHCRFCMGTGLQDPQRAAYPFDRGEPCDMCGGTGKCPDFVAVLLGDAGRGWHSPEEWGQVQAEITTLRMALYNALRLHHCERECHCPECDEIRNALSTPAAERVQVASEVVDAVRGLIEADNPNEAARLYLMAEAALAKLEGRG